MSEHIVPSAQARVTEAEQRLNRAQDPCALRVAAARGHLLRCRSSPMHTGIDCVASPCICPRGARNATRANSRTGSWGAWPIQLTRRREDANSGQAVMHYFSARSRFNCSR